MTPDHIKQTAADALSLLPGLLNNILPGGRLIGKEYTCGNLTGGPGNSCKVNVSTGKWSDFATGESGGDLVSLLAAIRGCSQSEAAEELDGKMGHASPLHAWRASAKTEKWQPVLPVPDYAPQAPTRHPRHGEASMVWHYRNMDGELLQIVNRFDFTNGKKQVLPLTFCENSTGRREWRWQALPAPRPLYGLDIIDSSQYAVVVEGEKVADAARRLLQDLPVIVTTWPGGSNAVSNADWSPLKGKKVVIWPDTDVPGTKAALAVAEAALAAGAVSVKIVEPPADVTEGWDLADAETEGWTREQVMDKLRAGLSSEEFQAKYMPTPAPAQENPSQAGVESQGPEARPEPLPLLRIIQKSDPFPLEVLPPVIQAAAARVREVVQAPLDLVCQSFLAAATLATQSYFDVLIDGRRFPVSNNFLAFGISGERKTAVDRIATGPIKELQHEQAQAYHTGMQKFEAKHAAWLNKRKAAFKEDDRNVIEALLNDAGDEPKHVQPCYLFSEPSFQGIERAFSEGRYTLGLFSDEGGRFLGGYAMNKENLINTITGLSKLWDGDPLDRMRGGDGLTILYGRRFSVHLMMQPVLAGQLFGNSMMSGQGLLSRCLCSWPESTIGSRPYKAVNLAEDIVIQAYNTAIKAILDAPLPMHEREEMGLSPQALTLTPEAKLEWVGFHNHVEELQKPGSDLFPITGFASKAPEHSARIAGVLTAFQNPDATQINVESMKAGIAIAEYYLGEALRLFHSSNDDPLLTLAEECFQYGMEKTGGVIGLRNLYQFGPNAVRSQEKAMQVMKVLEEHYRAVKIPGSAVVVGKCNRDAWRLVPLEV